MNIRNLVTLFMMMTGLFAQSISGIVDSEKPLQGANVVVVGTELGSVSNGEGSYLIKDVPAGTYDVTASYIGYSSKTISVVVGEDDAVVDFNLKVDVVSMSALEVLASRADKTTPAAYTTLHKEDMEFRLGSQDIPMILNTTPSVYATQQGGGAGDARINVRGFNQRNGRKLHSGYSVCLRF